MWARRRYTALPSLSTFVAALLDVRGGGGGVGGGGVGGGVDVEALELDLPVELDIISAGSPELVGALGASPPTQRWETTVMPVFHRLGLGIVAEAEDVHG